MSARHFVALAFLALWALLGAFGLPWFISRSVDSRCAAAGPADIATPAAAVASATPTPNGSCLPVRSLALTPWPTLNLGVLTPASGLGAPSYGGPFGSR